LLIGGSLLLVGCVSFTSDGGTSTVPGDAPITSSPSSAPTSTSTSTTVALPTTELRVIDPEFNAISGAAVGDLGVTGDDGYLRLTTPSGPVTVEANGYLPELASEWFPGEQEIMLQPKVVGGVVQTPAGDLLEGATAVLGGTSATTDAFGRFVLSPAPIGVIQVEKPGWSSVEIEWLGSEPEVSLTLEPEFVRALHVSGWAVGDADHWQRILDLAATTEINSLAVDLKDESGRVFYPSTVALAEQVDAIGGNYLLEDVVATMADHGLYLIGRIVTFQDPTAARAAPELAVWDSSRGAPYEKNGQYFLDPTDPVAQQYALDLAVEACQAGFDEIQFDYVRFPDGFGSSAVFDGGASTETRPIVIRDFLSQAGDLLHPHGCAVAADIFGFITSTTGDGGIGQQLEELARVTDVLSPMLYPSHYSEGWFGFAVPNDHPGPVIAAALDDGLARLDSTAVFRPWIQDFLYNSTQVRAEIDAAESRGSGWMLWNVFSRFSEGALNPAE
ncbi:MAG: hypothetical protein OEX97_12140, partial [Acidimicrobiia bacterium]|nr:hypothetical protein [Acidimicrobiia bacterium]